MKTKTIKTPSVGLMLFPSIYAKCYDFVFKSALLSQSHTTCHIHCVAQTDRRKKQKKLLLHGITFPCAAGFSCFCFLSGWNPKGIDGGAAWFLSGSLPHQQKTGRRWHQRRKSHPDRKSFFGFCFNIRNLNNLTFASSACLGDRRR